MRKGEVLRVSQPEGPQVCDFNAFSIDNPREHFWSGRTRILEGPHLKAMNRLWSTKVRPMFTLIADTVAHAAEAGAAKSHDLLFARCSREMWEQIDGVENLANCQDNLAAAIRKFGLSPDHVHDAFNLFMCTGIDAVDQRLYYVACDSARGDYVDLFAEMDCIVALAACPCGDGADDPALNPLRAEIFTVP